MNSIYSSIKSTFLYFQVNDKHIYHQKFPYKCEHCTESFSTEDERDTHINQKHPTLWYKKIFVCTLCDKSFPKRHWLKSHIERSHLKIKPYKCEEEACEKAFINQAELQEHRDLSHEVILVLYS